MSERIYVDTNIYLDYADVRTDGIRPLDELAFSVFQRTLSCEFEIVASDFVIEEILANLKNKTTFNLLVAELKEKKKLIYVEATRQEFTEAKRSKNWTDTLHAIIAKRTNCKYIVTRNIVDFLKSSDILEPVLPEQL